MSSEGNESSLKASLEEVWYLKDISFRPEPNAPPKRLKIITQNFNGPCSFIAICNILLLRGQIEILPQDRITVSYDILAQLIGDFILKTCPGVDVSAALTIMPVTRKGMDLNPLFTGATLFKPAGAGGELKLFEQVGIKLVHGWLVDPGSPEYPILRETRDYDTSVNLLVEADHLTDGQLVLGEDFGSAAQGSSSGSNGPQTRTMSATDAKKVKDAFIIRNFIDSTQSQLTYHGLFTLASSLPDDSLSALFRNSHLSVLYKSSGPDAALYTLVTDQVFLHEASVVWERLEDVDGSSSTFVDSEFIRSSPAGGDYAGYTALDVHTEAMTLEEQADHHFARQLQAEEDERAREYYMLQEVERLRREREQREMQEQQARVEAPQQQDVIPKPKTKKKSECLIM